MRRLTSPPASRVLAALALALSWSSGEKLLAQGSQSWVWTPLNAATEAAKATGTPLFVVITSARDRSSAELRQSIEQCPEIRTAGRALLFSELSADVYPAYVKGLGVTSVPTCVIYRRGADGKLKSLGVRSGFTHAEELLEWAASLRVVAFNSASVDPAVMRAGGHGGGGASPQTYASEQSLPPPTPPRKDPPQAPPYQQPYQPPPQPPVQNYPVYQQPQVQSPYASIPPPTPVYLQTTPPPMIVQQAPQQIILGPTPPPQVTVVQAAPMGYAPVGNAPVLTPSQPMQAPPGQPMQAPPSYQPMQAPPAYQPMQAPSGQPMQAPQQQPMQAPQGGSAPNAMVLEAPNPIGRVVGGIGSYLARYRNPRLQMGQAPMLAPMPQMAPVGQAPGGASGYWTTGYMPAGGPMPMQGQMMSPESTYMAPCNTWGAVCRFHNGPCPGNGGYGGGGGGNGGGRPEPYPAASPQTQQAAGRHSFFSRRK